MNWTSFNAIYLCAVSEIKLLVLCAGRMLQSRNKRCLQLLLNFLRASKLTTHRVYWESSIICLPHYEKDTSPRSITCVMINCRPSRAVIIPATMSEDKTELGRIFLLLKALVTLLLGQKTINKQNPNEAEVCITIIYQSALLKKVQCSRNETRQFRASCDINVILTRTLRSESASALVTRS